MTSSATSNDAADPLIGVAVAGRYRLESVIARGGVGRVYKGVQEPLGRYVAVKVLDPLRAVRDSQAEAHTKRFLREATVSARLNHPNTVVVHDYGTLDDGRLFLVMEYLEGPTLRQVLQRDGALDVARALHIGGQIASSLIDAHEAGVVHRDLKPPNVILVSRGGDPEFVKVVDFGLVKSIYTEEDDDLTMEGSFVGSPAYMSPEQATGQNVDQRTDIYSFGTVLYELIAGRPPFRALGERPQAGKLIAAHLTEKPPALADVRPGVRVPLMLEALVMQCLAKSPQLRPKSMREVLAVIEQVERDVAGGGAWSRQPMLDRPTDAGAGAPIPAGIPRAPAPPQPHQDSPMGSSTHGTVPRRTSRAAILAAAGLVLLVFGYLGARWIDSRGKASSDDSAGPPAHASSQEPVNVAAPVPAEGGASAKGVVPAPAVPTAAPALGGPPSDLVAEAPPVQVGAAPAAPSPAVAMAVPSTEPPLPPDISIRIESVPPGADVLAGDDVLGTTPFLAIVPREELADHAWVLRKPGFRDAPATPPEHPDEAAEELLVSVELQALPKAPQVRKPPKGPSQTKGSMDIKLTR